MTRMVLVFVGFSLLLPSYLATGHEALATHTDIFIPVLEMDPKNPGLGEDVKITTVVTNKGNSVMPNLQISYGLDGVWIIEDIHVNVPAQKSVKISFTAVMPVSAGQHQLKACPARETLGDDGDQCQTLDFTAKDEPVAVVSIVSPKEEEILRESATIRVAAFGQDASKVELYVQNELVDTKYQAPFDFTLDTTKYEDGVYKIYAIAYYDSGISKPSAVKKYFIDNSGSVIVTVMQGLVREAQARVGQSVIIESDITNKQSYKTPATFIVLVKDSNGFTEFLSWEEDKIPINGTIPMSQLWIPEAGGKYAVEVFLWDTIENAVPIADVMRASILVN